MTPRQAKFAAAVWVRSLFTGRSLAAFRTWWRSLDARPLVLITGEPSESRALLVATLLGAREQVGSPCRVYQASLSFLEGQAFTGENLVFVHVRDVADELLADLPVGIPVDVAVGELVSWVDGAVEWPAHVDRALGAS